MTPTRWTALAHLLRPQGRKGELLAELLTDFPESLPGRPHLFLAAPNFTGEPEQARPAEIVSSWLPTGRNAGRVVLGLAGVDSITVAEAIAGLDLITPETARIELEEGSRYVADLVGCQVVVEGEPLGAITEVYFSTTPDGTRRLIDVAPLLTVVTRKGDEVVIPYVKEFLLSEDLPARVIHMRLPPGLLDLNH